MRTANTSRREFLTSCGALVVSFSAASSSTILWSQGPFDTHESNVDPNKLDSWIAVKADGTVLAYTGKCDFGQGMMTAQTQLVAEELCVPIDRVNLVMCDTAVTPDQGSTSGSQSSPTNFNDANLALAAATAREGLISMAAERFGVQAGEVTVVDGVVSAKSGQRVSYEELIGDKRFDLPLSKTAKRMPQKDWRVLGKPLLSLDRPQLMTGHFEFVQYVKVPGMLHGRVVRPKNMGAKLSRVNEKSVEDIPGLVKVVVRKNFVGVVAETQYAAILAADKLDVEWIPGPKLPDHQTYFEYLQNLPSHDVMSVDSGDLEKQLKESDVTLHARYTYPHQLHGSLGSSCAVADVRSSSATIWSGTQSVYPMRSIAAKLLGMPAENVRVIFRRGSGCYGLNGADAVSFDAAILSQAVGKPVRLQFSRKDEMMWENFGAAMVVEHRAGLKTDGTIMVWNREDWVADRGGRTGYDQPGNLISGMLLGYDPAPFQPSPASKPTGDLRLQSSKSAVPPYLSGCIDGVCGGAGTVRSERVLTHTVRSPFFTGPLRSPQRIQNTFATEGFMDELAAHANADPLGYRLTHLADERLRRVLKEVANAAEWQLRPHRQRSLPPSGKVSGRGIACVAYGGSVGYNGYAGMVVDVDIDLESGVVHPLRFFCALDCGPVSNPNGLKNQIEGGILQGTSRALGEEATWDRERVTSIDWSTYNSLRLDYELPSITSVLINPSGVLATGAGETAITLVPAVIGNAIFDATGARLRTVPFTPERVATALHTNTKPRK
jgi:CO/xanthine dehydrogenase Mo-binding subunit